ncbi:MAG TPA: prepilin-type N-terminal cleavage/methylation domain-containing protein [Candidatus Paceibacterota bacterium]|nr:prepilin-type N-terminal cleavage/methylation domain-containing protein [Candidatus Paceibacterota bacterium]
MKSFPLRRTKGFTLVETVMAIALTALVSLAIGQLLRYFYATDSYALQESQAVASARRALDDSMRALREASYGADGSYPIKSAATSSITFFADLDGGGTIEQVTYAVAQGVLYAAVVEPASSSYAGGATATTTIASYVTNGADAPVFTYYDASGTPLSAPVDIAEVASVETTVVVDVNINRAPVAFTLSGEATLRNLRDQSL